MLNNVKDIMTTSRSFTFMIEDGGNYYTEDEYDVYLNNNVVMSTNKNINTLYNLMPDTKYNLCVKGTDSFNISFRTESEFCTINVKNLGAYGDGIHDDTAFIQGAIMACPANSRVLIPKGRYSINTIFLKSDISMEIEKDALLIARSSIDERVFFPGEIDTFDESDDKYQLGTWEGNPNPMFAGIICGIGVENVNIYGEGTVDGGADFSNWWENPKTMKRAYRPRLLFLKDCKNIRCQGVMLINSPSWTIHPYFSSQLLFCDMYVKNPSNSPNTDGLDPECCDDVTIVGMHFSLGDDCIAIKSGKIYVGQKYKTPSNNIHIMNCLMENGHGAVTLGSEIAGGVTNILVEKCLFRNTDRGLRIKTRRGRGKQCFLNNIMFKDIMMDNVLNPFTANMFYFCDPDGHEEYVQSPEYHPVDERTPSLGILRFENIKAVDAHVSAAYFLGLPESKIEAIEMKNVDISMAKNPQSGVPVMSDLVSSMSGCGIYARNVKRLVLENVKVTGQKSERVITVDVDEVIDN